VNKGHSSAQLPVHLAHYPLDALFTTLQPLAVLQNFHPDPHPPRQDLAVITAVTAGHRCTANISDTLLFQSETLK